MPASAAIRRSRRSWSRRADADGDLRLRAQRRLARAFPHCAASWAEPSFRRMPDIAFLIVTAVAFLVAGFVKGVVGLGLADRGDRPSRPRHGASPSRRASRGADLCHQCLAARGRTSPPFAAATALADAARPLHRNADRPRAADRRCRPSSDDRTRAGAHRLRALGPKRDAATGAGACRTMALAPDRRGHGSGDRRDGGVRASRRSVPSGARSGTG